MLLAVQKPGKRKSCTFRPLLVKALSYNWWKSCLAKGSVVPIRSEDELGSTKVTDQTNYTLQSKAQHKDEDDDEKVDEFKTDEPVESNGTENEIETKLVEPEEELYKPYKTNSIELHRNKEHQT